MPPDLPEPVRILSDLHWGHPVSLVRRPEQVAPLLEGAGTVVFNGDTVEQRRGSGGAGARADAAAFAELCEGLGTVPVFVSGNHDPGVSERAALEFAEGRILVTHGDVLFPEISTWGDSLPELKARCEALFRNGVEPSDDGLASLITNVREVCGRKIEERRGDVGFDFTAFLLRQAWPPTRALTILRCWAESSVRGAGLAERHTGATRFVILGHSHYPGIWHRNGSTVINTGSFFPFMGRRLVELGEGRVTVRRIARRGRTFCPGNVAGSWKVEFKG